MIKDYKGEMPKNVTTPEKAKAKKPFYKDWKFWVLTGLMTLFGACSIYGLVLGSQYVKAIERASHIIADAQSGQVQSESLKKMRHLANASDEDIGVVELYDLGWTYNPDYGFISVNRISNFKYNENDDYSTPGRMLCARYKTTYYSNISWGHTQGVIACGTNQYPYILIGDLSYNNATDFKNSLQGVYLYYLTDGTGENAHDTFYGEGYDDGYEEGHSDGYQEGFDDGADSQANEQTIKVLLAPDFTGDRIQYTYTLDGAEVGTGYLSNTNQHYQNQVQFSRPAGGQHSAVLNLYSDNDEPIKIAYDTFTGTLGETRYLWYQKSNAYDWSTSQWYVPTYWAEARFLVTGYGTYDQGFTEDYFFNLDPQYNDRAKVGAYSEGYDAGYNDAVESGDAYDAGYDSGYADGQAQGETEGFNRGVAVGSNGSQSLAMMFKTAFQLPFDQLYRFLNFNLLGINFLSLFTALISVSIGIMVIKKVL